MLLRRVLGARRLCTAATPAVDAPTGSALRWAVGGWTFFIAENALLSENRAHIISALGDDEKETKYHMLYGTISTAACVSIGYGYLRRARNAPPFLWAVSAAPPVWRLAAGVLLQGIGFAGLAQGLPLLQSPVAMAAAETSPAAATAAPPAGWVVRCPFNFVDKDVAPAEDLGPGPHGAQRVTRHPGFWSFGLVCLGAAATVPSIPQAAWLCMPGKPSPGVYFWPYPVFEAVGYGEIQRDTARYVRIQLHAVRYSGIRWICCKIARCR